MRVRNVSAIAAATAVFSGTALLASGALSSAASPDSLYVVDVTITNLAPDGGTIQTPVWAAVHDGSFDLYDQNAAISPSLERLAEDGNTAPITDLFAAAGHGQDATLATAAGPLFQGDSASHTFVVDASDASSRYFSFASMVIPSNDAFVANGDPLGHELFDANGNVVAANFVVPGSAVLDAGSEVNDEIPEHTAALAQAAPDTGVTEGGVVQPHPGFLPGGNVLAAIPNGDFTQAGYETISVEFDIRQVNTSNRIVYSTLDGFQEVPANDTNSLGYTLFRIRENGTRINVDTQLWNTDNVVAAHLHMGSRGENGPVVVTLFSGAASGVADGSHIDGRFFARALQGPLAGQPLSVLIDAIDQGDVYINVHTVDNPSGELRGQLVP